MLTKINLLVGPDGDRQGILFIPKMHNVYVVDYRSKESAESKSLAK